MALLLRFIHMHEPTDLQMQVGSYMKKMKPIELNPLPHKYTNNYAKSISSVT